MSRSKVRIKKLPASYGDQTPPSNTVAYPGNGFPNYGNTAEVQINRTLPATDWENATLEAEQGETVITNLQGEGIPEFYTVGGKRHYDGGTPLNLPPNSFFFSRDRKAKIKDPMILKMFGKSGKKALTPADISKQYDINRYRQILADPNSDKYQVDTAELMIKNFNLKLGGLALVQEAPKGFETGIPAVAIPYLEHMGVAPEELLEGGSPFTKDSAPAFKHGGQYTGKERVRVISLPKHQDGSEVKTSDKPTRVQNIPEDAVMWDPNADGYNPDDVQPGDYIKQADGTWHVAVGYGPKKAKTLYKDDRLGGFQEHYSFLYEKFQDPKFREAFVKEYRKKMETAKPNTSTNLTQQDIDEAKKMSDEEVINTFLYKQKVNFAINAKIGDLDKADQNDAWDKLRNSSQDLTKELGFEVYDKAQVAAFQGAYAGLEDMTKNPEYKDLMKDIDVDQFGWADEPGAGTGEKTISDIDGWDGNTTSAQVAKPRDTELITKPAPYTDVTEETEAAVDHLGEPKQAVPGKWWTQDIVNLAGAMGDYFTAKKYDPWQATPQFTPATPTFTDFRGTAARIGSQGAGLANAFSALNSPQSAGAVFANIQSGMVDPILQTQQQEAQTNVGVANQFELANVQMKNEYDANRANLDTMLYDKSVMANQAFDNTKRAFREKIRQMFNQGWTNKGMTQNMNTFSQNYAIDPRTGYKYFTGKTGDIVPQKGDTMTFEENVAAIKNRYPDMTWEAATKIAKGNAGIYEQDYPMGVRAEDIQYQGQ